MKALPPIYLQSSSTEMWTFTTHLISNRKHSEGLLASEEHGDFGLPWELPLPGRDPWRKPNTNSEQLPLRFRLLGLLGDRHAGTSLESSSSKESFSSDRVGIWYSPVISKPALLSTETYQQYFETGQKTESVFIIFTSIALCRYLIAVHKPEQRLTEMKAHHLVFMD